MFRKCQSAIICLLFIFAIPAVASGHEITDPNGPVPVEETLTFGSANVVIHLGGGNVLKCGFWSMNGIVEKNAGAEVLIGMDEANDFTEECTLVGNPAVVVPTLTSIDLNLATTTLKMDFLINGICPQNTTAAITYISGAKIFGFQGVVNGPAGCLNAVIITGNFIAFDNAGPITFD